MTINEQFDQKEVNYSNFKRLLHLLKNERKVNFKIFLWSGEAKLKTKKVEQNRKLEQNTSQQKHVTIEKLDWKLIQKHESITMYRANKIE